MPSRHYREFEHIKKYARDLRKNLTPSESRVWNLLRKRQILNYRFLRQHPIFYRIDGNWIENYIADFYCRELSLVIEIDGKIHEKSRDYDQERDSKLEAKGLKVVRISNDQANETTKLKEMVIKVIIERESEIK